MKKLILGVVALLIATPAMAQVKSPIYIDRNGSYQGAQGTVCIKPDGTACTAGTVADPVYTTGGIATGTAGSPNTAVVSVQGVAGGTVVPISAAALPLPTGAATETTLSAASAKLPASLGAKTGATSLSVVPASDGFTVIANGNIANGIGDSGNPIKMGGYASAAIPTVVADTARVNLWLGVNGQMVIGGTSYTGADGASNTLAQSTITSGSAGLFAGSNYVFNGTTWDRQRGDTNGSYSVAVPVATALAGTAPVVTSAVASTLVGKAGAGNLYGINAVAGASAGFVLVTNTTTAPADGVVTPSLCYPVAANGVLSTSYSTPVAFPTGISVSFSTTGCFLKTASATAFISVAVK